MTRGNARLNLTIALNYGARAEIVAAARALAEQALAGTLDPGRDQRGPLRRASLHRRKSQTPIW